MKDAATFAHIISSECITRLTDQNAGKAGDGEENDRK